MIVKLSEEAIKNIRDVNKNDAMKIKERIQKFVDYPESCNFRKLQGYKNRYRIRQGNYRIICEFVEESEKCLYIISVKHRSNAYKD
ncbi:MAG: type II toxin-antitoxin system RelE/ParE family toxin [Candidatus Gastranaerophilales bacterium]|nr:type II toxin-antitoxin system RelE/ParE family toxin [Candidatus Gastranaerophilales bacterium]